MMRLKIIIIVLLVFLSSFTLADVLPSSPDYILDQKQELSSLEEGVHSRIWLAQSFIPSMTPLTKIEVKIDKPRLTSDPLIISIRKELNGSDLASFSISGDDIPFFVFWVGFDIPDIEVTVGDTYYIVMHSSTPTETPFRWLYEYNYSDDPYPKGKMWRSIDRGKTWYPMEGDEDLYIDATFRTYSYISKPDLECSGYLNWTDVKPYENLTGSFTVRNIGTPLSYVSWKILSWPSWGTWSFNPMNGTNLKPEDGSVTVQVFVEAPHSKVPDEYLGKIIIVNTDNPDDICTINARLVTPKGIHRISILDLLPFLRFYNRLFFQLLLD